MDNQHYGIPPPPPLPPFVASFESKKVTPVGFLSQINNQQNKLNLKKTPLSDSLAQQMKLDKERGELDAKNAKNNDYILNKEKNESTINSNNNSKNNLIPNITNHINDLPEVIFTPEQKTIMSTRVNLNLAKEIFTALNKDFLINFIQEKIKNLTQTFYIKDETPLSKEEEKLIIPIAVIYGALSELGFLNKQELRNAKINSAMARSVIKIISPNAPPDRVAYFLEQFGNILNDGIKTTLNIRDDSVIKTSWENKIVRPGYEHIKKDGEIIHKLPTPDETIEQKKQELEALRNRNKPPEDIKTNISGNEKNITFYKTDATNFWSQMVGEKIKRASTPKEYNLEKSKNDYYARRKQKITPTR